jgi:polyhydroxyalkanoate synthase
VFKARHNFSGPVRFLLAGSGHIAGVINPPEAHKYQYWRNDAEPWEVDAWLKGATEHPGSWWPDWEAWLAPQSGEMVPARRPGDGKLAVIEDAPGSFVKVRST